MIYKTFEQWMDGNFLEVKEPRKKAYSKDELLLVEMGWNYGYDAGRAVEQALDKKAENARELGLDYEPVGLIARLKHPEQHYEFTDPKKANAVLMSLCQEAADALAAQQEHEPENEPYVSLASVQEPVASAAYDMVDRFLRNNLSSDADYAEYSAALDALYTTPPAQPAPVQPTNEQIDAAVRAWFENPIVAGQRPFKKRMLAAFEAAHGITEKGQP
jgi:hypothetical protein